MLVWELCVQMCSWVEGRLTSGFPPFILCLVFGGGGLSLHLKFPDPG